MVSDSGIDPLNLDFDSDNEKDPDASPLFNPQELDTEALSNPDFLDDLGKKYEESLPDLSFMSETQEQLNQRITLEDGPISPVDLSSLVAPQACVADNSPKPIHKPSSSKSSEPDPPKIDDESDLDAIIDDAFSTESIPPDSESLSGL